MLDHVYVLCKVPYRGAYSYIHPPMLWIYKCPCGKSIERPACRAGTCCVLLAGQGFHMSGHRWGVGIQYRNTLSCMCRVDNCGHSYWTQHNGNRFRNQNFQAETSRSNIANIRLIRSFRYQDTWPKILPIICWALWILLVSPNFPTRVRSMWVKFPHLRDYDIEGKLWCGSQGLKQLFCCCFKIPNGDRLIYSGWQSSFW